MMTVTYVASLTLKALSALVSKVHIASHGSQIRAQMLSYMEDCFHGISRVYETCSGYQSGHGARF